MRYVRIQDAAVAEIGDFSQDPNGVLFHPDIVWVQSETANDGDVYDGKGFSPYIKTAKQQRDEIDAKIATLEQQQLMPRITRETLLATAVTFAAAQGITEPQLYAAQIAYHKLKDFDTSIAALRAQRDAIV
jgi:hypothetical protein